MDELSLIQRVAVWALPVLFAITVHETAHGWVAFRLGDPTAKMLGRVTLNPLRHIDPIGTLLVPALLLMVGGFLFGWAKPVPITWRNLKRYRRDVALVAVAGPASNFLMALFWAALARVAVGLGVDSEGVATYLLYTAVAGIFVNILLGTLNLLPLPPLDGGRIATSVLPARPSWYLSRVEPYGFFILLGLLATGLLSHILWPPVQFLLTAWSGLAGLTPGDFSYLLNNLLS